MNHRNAYFAATNADAPKWPFEVRSVGKKNEPYPYKCVRAKGADFYIIFWTVEGQGYVKCGERKLDLKQNSLFIIPPDVPHEYGAKEYPGHWLVQWFTVWGVAAGSIMQGLGLDRFAVLEAKPPSEPFMEQLHSTIRMPEAHAQIEGARIGLRLLYEVAAKLDSRISGLEHSELAETAQWARLKIGSGIEVNDMAAHSDMSRSHFSRKFKADQGISPQQFLIQTRIDRAKDLLLTTRQSIKEIADNAGFCDPAYFCRQFLKNVGLNPTEFRKASHI